jgi:poly(A) polymerase
VTLNPQKQREFALQVVHRLRGAGYLAYWAGGCVRDQLLGRTPKDYDVATSARPEEVRHLFGRGRTFPVGAVFGVITVVGPPGAGHVEITTFRRDAEYHDGRHPQSVTFTEPAEDAARRDFTINGLFFDPLNNQVIDYVGGQDDLRAGVIRAIGDPESRFREDKLRMLRAVRFAASFEFQLEHQTLAAIQGMADDIHQVSPERIAQEMRLMLVDPNRVRALELLKHARLLAALLPEVEAMHGVPQHKPRQPGGDLWDHTLLVLRHLRSPSFELALATLLHDAGKPRTLHQVGDKLTFHEHEKVGAHLADKICTRWRLSNRERARIVWLVRYHQYLAAARQMRWAKLQRMLTTPGIEELLDLHEADALASSRDTADVDYCRELLRLPPEELNPPALLSGHDLIRHGLKPGKEFQLLLEKVRDAQLERRIRSKRDALALVDQLRAAGFEEPAKSQAVDKPEADA